MLLRLAPRLNRASLVVCAEQTSLWLPRLLPMRPKFINTLHGAGTMMTRADKRRQAAWKTLVPAEGERAALAAHGVDPDSIIRSEEQTSELQSLMRSSYAVFC